MALIGIRMNHSFKVIKAICSICVTVCVCECLCVLNGAWHNLWRGIEKRKALVSCLLYLVSLQQSNC